MIDDEGRRYTLWFTVDLTLVQPLVNGMVLAGIDKRPLKGSPFTAHLRKLTSGSSEGFAP